MLFSSWLKSLKSPFRHRKPARRARRSAERSWNRLVAAEVLEDRTLLSGGALFPGQTFDVGSAPESVATADFNSDGLIDLVTANNASGSVSILAGNGDGTFQTAQDFGAGFRPREVTTGDFDGDGAIDLAVAKSGGVTVLLGNGDGTFQPAKDFATGDSPLSVATGDFDGDGITDLVTTNGNGSRLNHNVSVLLGNGDGTFQAPLNFSIGTIAFSATTGDFNGDGLLDLTTANNTNNVSVLLGNGDGTFQTPQNFAVGGPVSVITGDFDGDGITDLATANRNGNNVSVLLGNGDGTFQAAQNFAVGSRPESVTTGDFDGDGAIDLATANAFSHSVSVLLGNGDGSFQTTRNVAVGALPNSVTAGDFDGDGATDLAAANGDSDNVTVMLSNGDGSFPSALRFAAASFPQSVTTDDFDGDSVVDLAVANEFNNVSVLLGNGDGTVQPAQNFAAGSRMRSLTTGDFDGDGVADLATANSDSDNVSVLLGNGDGTFQTAQNFAADIGPNSVTTGDFDGDGVIDLATANIDAGRLGSSDNVSILLGNGDGTFQAAQNFAVGSGPSSVRTGDFNGDGVIDLTTANPGAFANSVSVLLGNGDGTFQPAQQFTVASSPTSVTTGDFNSDGSIDLATANSSTSNVSVLLGNGDGTFLQPAQNFAIGSRPFSVTTGDIDGDGVLDLATANINSDKVSVLLGNGDGTFQTAQSFAVGPQPRSVTTGDFNGDGAIDLALAWRSGVAVLLNLGNEPPEVADITRTGSEDSPVAFAAADFIAKFSDPDTSDSLKEIRIDTLPANGALELNGVAVTAGQVISVADLESLAFVPDTNFNGETSFNYSASDGVEFSAIPATVTLDIPPVNDPPSVSGPVVVTSNEDAASFSVDLLSGASDVDASDTLNAVQVVLTGGDDAGITINGNSLDVDPSKYNHLAVGEQEVITYAYDISDGNGGTVAQTATITIEGRNDAPAVANLSRTGIEDSPVAFAAADFIAQFSDPDTSNSLKEIRIDMLPANGALELNGVAVTTGQVISVADLDSLAFVPATNFNGGTSFNYSASDGDGGSDTATVNITVTEVNDAPLASSDTATVAEENSVTIDVLGNDLPGPDNESTQSLAVVSASASHGAVIINSDQTLTYIPNPDFNGSDTINYTIEDDGTSNGVSDPLQAGSTVDVTVLNVVDLSGRVFDDLDNNGTFESADGDAGLPNVTIELVDESAGTVVATSTTDSAGRYEFDFGNLELATSTYTIRQQLQPSGLLDGLESTGDLGGDAADNGSTVDNADSNEITGIVIREPGTQQDTAGYDFAEIRPSSLQGLVWEDFDDDAGVDFGEIAIEGVTITLSGTDDRGNSVTQSQNTDGQGIVEFIDLRPGTYSISEAQPDGFIDGKDVVGEVNGVLTGDNDGGDPALSTTNDQFTNVVLAAPGAIGVNYNFGERVDGGELSSGQTATIGFWQNRNGQRLIKSLNGTVDSTRLAEYLSETFPNMYGLLGDQDGDPNTDDPMTNAQVADVYRQLFKRNARTSPGGPPKLDAQVMAVAMATYATKQSFVEIYEVTGEVDSTLVDEVESFGFDVTVGGVGSTFVNVGDNGEAFGVADGSDVQIIDLLLATDGMSSDGLLYDKNGDGVIDETEELDRIMANDIYSLINEV